MKKLAFIISVFCSFFLLGRTPLKAEGVYNISQYFPLEIDNTWIYRTALVNPEGKSSDISLSSIKKKSIVNGQDTYVLEINLDEKPLLCYSKDNDGIYLHKMINDENYSVFIPPLPVFTNRMQLNKEDIFSGKAKFYDNNDELIEEYKVEIKKRFDGIENITVPGGEFDHCLKIHLLTNYYKRKHTMTVEQTVWLAKNIGKIKEINVITVYNGVPLVFRNRLELQKAILRKE